MAESQTTRDRLQTCALELFVERGYDQTSVTEIARAAGVSHMTFFRHFPTKESVVVGDLFDPLIAAVVREQPSSLPALARTVNGFVTALSDPAAGKELSSPGFRERIRLAAQTPALRGAVWASCQGTGRAVAQALTDSGSPGPAAEAAAGAVVGACASILLAWAQDTGTTPATDALRQGLSTLVGPT